MEGAFTEFAVTWAGTVFSSLKALRSNPDTNSQSSQHPAAHRRAAPRLPLLTAVHTSSQSASHRIGQGAGQRAGSRAAAAAAGVGNASGCQPPPRERSPSRHCVRS